MAENNSLFGEFKPISYEEWHAQVIKDLKGADYGRKVVWNTLEGVSLEPFYRFEDVKDLAYTDALPGEKPFVRGSKPSHSWRIRQDFRAADPAEANRKALKALQKGAQSL
ncbi:MAG TPA: methylmalonyl-CoA mutase family protein, partial [Prolixibacteraceae bacterium]|nr:methylmalonyl-CoA mutase family protein [Prolixibacteraceae bacterium]